MRSAGHVFLSYVHEDADKVDEVHGLFDEAGVDVWRDKKDLWPGEDWKRRIREAITQGALVVVAFFSDASVARKKSYMNEELLVAIEELRLRPPDQPWLIPIRLSDCDLPKYDLGGGRDLDSLQRLDLFGDRQTVAMARLIASVVRLLPDHHVREVALAVTQMPSGNIKSLLRTPDRDIEMADRVSSATEELRALLVDPERFPYQSPVMNDVKSATYLGVELLDNYWSVTRPLRDDLQQICRWGLPEHESVVTNAIKRLGSTTQVQSGNVALINLHRFPLFPLMYTCAISAIVGERYGFLRAAVVVPTISVNGARVPVVSFSNVWWPFEGGEFIAQGAAFAQEEPGLSDELLDSLSSGRRGKRLTPASDVLHDRLRSDFLRDIPDDEEYTLAFDTADVLLAALCVDYKSSHSEQHVYLPPPSVGSYSWRYRHVSVPIEKSILADVSDAGASWAPLRSGLFGGDADRARAALESVAARADRQRQEHW